MLEVYIISVFSCLLLIAYLNYLDNSFLSTFAFVFKWETKQETVIKIMIQILCPYLNTIFACFLLKCVVDELKMR